MSTVAAAGAFSEYDFTWFLGTSTQLLYYYLTTTYLLSFTPFLPLFAINATNRPIYDYIVSTVIITESVASVNRDTIDNRNQAWYSKPV